MFLVLSALGALLDALARHLEVAKREFSLTPPVRAHLAQIHAVAMLACFSAAGGAFVWYIVDALGVLAFASKYPTAIFAVCLLVVAGVQPGTSLRDLLTAWALEGFVWGPLLASVVCTSPLILPITLASMGASFAALSNSARHGRRCEESIQLITPVFLFGAFVFCQMAEIGSFVGWAALYLLVVLNMLNAYTQGNALSFTDDAVADARSLMTNTLRALRVFLGAPTEGAGEFGKAVSEVARKKDV